VILFICWGLFFTSSWNNLNITYLPPATYNCTLQFYTTGKFIEVRRSKLMQFFPSCITASAKHHSLLAIFLSFKKRFLLDKSGKLLHLLIAKIRRCPAEHFLETTRKVTGVLEADVKSDFRHRFICFLEQPGSLFQPARTQICQRGLSGH